MSKFKYFIDYVRDNKKVITQVGGWNEFEKELHKALVLSGFKEVNPEDDITLLEYVSSIRCDVHDKTKSVLLRNSLYDKDNIYKDFFLVEPYGTQNYPDIMAFTRKHIIMVESKFSGNSGTKPMWNSNVPKKDSFYVFGSRGRQDLAVFTGDSILSPGVRERLVEITDESIGFTNDNVDRFKRDYLEGNDFNFTVYPRMAYAQGASLLDGDKNDELYNDVISLIEEKDL